MTSDAYLWHRRALLSAFASLAALPAYARIAPARTPTSDPFALGVASGDPAQDGFVLWTRLVGPHLTQLDAPVVHVRYELAEDDAFQRIVRRGEGLAHAAHGHSVHVELQHLPAGRPYWYRFHALGVTSPVGRTRTVPGRTDRLRLAVTSCQHWEQGWFGAYHHILEQQPDLFLQLGDYIYEQHYPDTPTVRRFGAGEPQTLAEYRQRHALYKSDPLLQRAHAFAPWLVTWDDHEVLNDYAGLANRLGLPPAAFAPRRAAAYQAYFEHMPIRPSLWRSGGGARLYRALDWADLASISVLDTRQYRSAPPCSAPNMARNVRLDACADAARPDRSILGQPQERWLAARLDAEVRPWTIIAQQVFFAPLALDSGGTQYWSDQWDGYAANRTRLLNQLSAPQVKNAVVLSGDVHSFWVNHLSNAQGRVVASELVTAALAASSPPAGRFGDIRANNPHIRFSDVDHAGYLMVDINSQRLSAQMMRVDHRQQGSAAARLAEITQEAGGGHADVTV